jgi:hypothetical protein
VIESDKIRHEVGEPWRGSLSRVLVDGKMENRKTMVGLAGRFKAQ